MSTCMRGLCARAACTCMECVWSRFPLGWLAVAAAHKAAICEGGCIPLACLQCCLLTAHPVVRSKEGFLHRSGRAPCATACESPSPWVNP